MSYLGQVELKSSEIRRIDVTGSTSATHTLTWTPPSEQSLIITINGLKQQNNYSIAGTTLTLDTALIVTDAMEVIGILDIGEATIPPDDSITTAMVKDDAIDADKLANSINTEIAANTAKVTNATHTGDVTGATALTIAVDAVDIAMLSATGTASASTFLRGDNAWAAAGVGDGDVTVAKLSASVTEADNVKQRVAKAWCAYNEVGSAAILDSFNVSSITDNGTGDVTVTYTVAMGQADYVAFGTVTHSSKGVVSITDQTALLVQAITREANTATMTDYGKVSVIAFGDS